MRTTYKILLVVAALLALSGLTTCGIEPKCVTDGSDCHGEKGDKGSTGSAGKNGNEGAQGPVGPAGVPGTSGRDGKDGDKGTDGTDGQAGPTGAPGVSGISLVFRIDTVTSGDAYCEFGGTRIRVAQDTNRNGVLDTADEGQQFTSVCNGVPGQDAPATAFTPIQIIDPCGNNPGVIDEVLLKLSDGTIIASFSDNANGNNTRFSILPPGEYVTTDGSSCHFQVTSTGAIISH